MRIFDVIRILIMVSIAGMVIYKTIFKKETSFSSLIEEAMPLLKENKAMQNEKDETGPLGTFGMS